MASTHITTDSHTIYSSRISVVPSSLVSENISTSACEMNFVNSSVDTSHSIQCSDIDAPQVIVFDAVHNSLNSVIIPETKEKASHFHIDCYLSGWNHTVCVAAMVDSGATVLFLNKKYTDRQKIRMVLLERSISLYNIDRTLNEAGSIMHKARLNLKVGSEVHQHDFYVTQIGPEKVILWLCMRNPSIQWLK